MTSSLFSKLAQRIDAIRGERYPLHIGDTYLLPAAGCRVEDIRAEDVDGLNRYANPQGHPALLEAICEHRDLSDPARVLATTGATGALDAIAGALLAPGDEVLVLAPYWPLIRGIVTASGGRAVDVPFYDRLRGTGEDVDLVRNCLQPFLSPRSAAIYVNTPNNPTGRVLSSAVVEAIAQFAEQEGLYLWSDEVYEDYAWARPHVSPATFAPERTFAVYSFSKAFGMAGNRCGYIIGPPGSKWMGAIRKVTTHSFYSVPTASQIAASRVLRDQTGWLSAASAAYQEAGNAAARKLGLPDPEGGTFLFIDVASQLDERGLQGFLENCIDQGLILAPGRSCGSDYADHVRLCFTCAPPDVTARGVDVLANILGISS